MVKNKELSSKLFGDAGRPKSDPVPDFNLESMKLGLPMEPIDLDRQMESTERNIQTLKSEFQSLANSQTEINQNTRIKVDRLQTSLSRLEHVHNAFVSEVSEKFHQLFQKLNEHKKVDQKTQDMVDRHANLLKGYEVRMSQLQKIIAQKEIELVEMQTLLNDAKMEIARLKRL